MRTQVIIFVREAISRLIFELRATCKLFGKFWHLLSLKCYRTMYAFDDMF